MILQKQEERDGRAMVALCTRRVFVTGGAILSHLLNIDAPSTDSVSKLICDFTPRAFRVAVAESGRFLYRGEIGVSRADGKILCPEPDLLFADTYEDPAALEYFRCLERRLISLNVRARPSTGHIGTSKVSEAARWGDAVSVWPLGTELSFVWPTSGELFYPTVFLTKSCPNDDLAINRDLTIALEQGHEILFASSFGNTNNELSQCPLSAQDTSAFLAVQSSKFDDDLFRMLKKSL